MELRTPKRGLWLPRYHLMSLLVLLKTSGNTSFLLFNSSIGRGNEPISVPLDSNKVGYGT